MFLNSGLSFRPVRPSDTCGVVTVRQHHMRLLSQEAGWHQTSDNDSYYVGHLQPSRESTCHTSGQAHSLQEECACRLPVKKDSSCYGVESFQGGLSGPKESGPRVIGRSVCHLSQCAPQLVCQFVSRPVGNRGRCPVNPLGFAGNSERLPPSQDLAPCVGKDKGGQDSTGPSGSSMLALTSMVRQAWSQSYWLCACQMLYSFLHCPICFISHGGHICSPTRFIFTPGCYQAVILCHRLLPCRCRKSCFDGSDVHQIE
jgi:hypothetical protein